MSFNCKNIETSKGAIQQLSESADIILLQEHWYFDCQLGGLTTVCDSLTGAGKAVDTGDPILPVQMPRGYGGVAALWRKSIDHLIKAIPDGANRIQCLEVQAKSQILIVSVYMPCKGLRDNSDEFEDCLEQLHEIVQKYKNTHSIILGGDFNEAASGQNSTRRAKSFSQFLMDNQLFTKQTPKTYVGPAGTEVSTIDYIFYSEGLAKDLIGIDVLEDLALNVSDHYPLLCTLNIQLDVITSSSTVALPPTKTRWDKVDKALYEQAVSECVSTLQSGSGSLGALDAEICKLNKILVEAAEKAGPTRVKRPRKAKLKTWNDDIKQAVQSKKRAFMEWKLADRPNDPGDILVQNKKLTTTYLRRLCRIEAAACRENERQQILDAKSADMKQFYRLVNKQRGKLRYCVNELSVDGQTYKTEDEILGAWRRHFGSLATPTNHEDFDEEYRQLVASEMLDIVDICSSLLVSDADHVESVSQQQVKEAMELVNRGKPADIHGVSVEHFLHGGEVLLQKLTEIINTVFRFGRVTETLTIGTLTPVFKNKGSSTEAKNYRGITVLPTITKIIETLLRDRVQPIINDKQNYLQRGFTKHSSPMNCSLIVEETIREYKDLRKPVYIAFLDAKSAFDVVSYESLLRKLFHAGVEGVTWSLIHSLHAGAESAVKWGGKYSEVFKVDQGVRQGGILSTDLYKLYGNGLLDRLEMTGVGCHIGEISCVAPACADDLAILAEDKRILQFLTNIAVDFSCMERYLLQPVKSVLIQILQHAGCLPSDETVVTMKEQPMPVVEEAMHMGILRSAETQETTVTYNIQKARRTVYSLMGSGLHGENGLDPETSIHLLQTYVLPVLVYGLEVVLPKATLVEKLEKTYKKFLKHILSLPVTVADSAVYVLSGALPVEGVIHKRALTLFGSICRLEEDTVEKRVARRQLAVKTYESNSWFIAVRKLFLKYNLPECWSLIENPQSKHRWKSMVDKHVNDYWVERIKTKSALYSSLEYLSADEYYPGNRHWLLHHTGVARDIPCTHVKLKLVTGTYILQVNRVAFNQNQIDPTCMLCNQEPETVDHFLKRCSALSQVRKPIMDSIISCVGRFMQVPVDDEMLIKLLLDCTGVICDYRDSRVQNQLRDLEKLTKRLCYTLHVERYKRLNLIPKRKKKAGGKGSRSAQ